MLFRSAIIINKRVRNAVLRCNLKNDRMISVRFQGKRFNIMVIQAYAPTNNAEEAEVEWFYWVISDEICDDCWKVLGENSLEQGLEKYFLHRCSIK